VNSVKQFGLGQTVPFHMQRARARSGTQTIPPNILLNASASLQREEEDLANA